MTEVFTEVKTALNRYWWLTVEFRRPVSTDDVAAFERSLCNDTQLNLGKEQPSNAVKCKTCEVQIH